MCQRHRKDPPVVDTLRDFYQTCLCYQLVNLRLGTPPHHPCLPISVTGQRSGYELQLWVPGLSGVYDVAARLQRFGDAGKRAADHLVVAEQLVETRYHYKRGARRECGQIRLIECVCLDESSDLFETLCPDQGTAVAYIDIAVIAQENRGRAFFEVLYCLENVAAMAAAMSTICTG